jgi:hypothetical protein
MDSLAIQRLCAVHYCCNVFLSEWYSVSKFAISYPLQEGSNKPNGHGSHSSILTVQEIHAKLEQA